MCVRRITSDQKRPIRVERQARPSENLRSTSFFPTIRTGTIHILTVSPRHPCPSASSRTASPHVYIYIMTMMMITPLIILIGWFVVSVVPVLAFLPPPTTTTSQQPQPPRWVSRLGVTRDDDDVTRRDCLWRIPGSIFGILTSTTTILSSFPQSVVSVTNGDDPSSSTTRSASEIARILHPVPTFTIVDADGVPFMVVGEDAKVTGYFFTTYTEAQRILTLARTSVDASIRDERTQQQQQQRGNVRPTTTTVSQSTADPVLINPWKSARISTVPLDVAVTLSLKGLNGNTVRNYFQVAAAETDIQTALQLTNQTSLAEGKVPLFYIPDWTLNDQTTTTTPLYFSQDELIRAYQTQNPSSSRPAIQVTELFAVLTAMATNDDDMQNTTIVLVPPRSSAQWVRQCNAQNAGKPPFQLGQRNIVL